ncbi:Pseudouridine synthase, RluD (chromatophore) [Paulinella micropora]|uniref:Pseudouridine synthase n=1 Tax=Paulinella micropora TaxID=1928728 RepID=A0A1L5YBR6_9EUKA|nr:Pseudouridine synthase, RluD [Paulinella micropora]AQX44898.1 pseudouridine synthase [Paulinella micropora]BBL86112.1 Pseudouridine synthase, RluD [Paulinella micropora]
MNSFNNKDGKVLRFCYTSPLPMRLDRWLVTQQPEQSRARIQKFIDAGFVRINGIRSRAKTPLKCGDEVQVWMPPPEPLPYLLPQQIPLDVLFEDKYLIVINKPAGLTVHPAPGNKHGTLVNGLISHCPDLVGIGGEMRPGIVHRLDRATTGCIVVAKTQEVLVNLQSQIQRRVASREYIAIVHGVPVSNRGTIVSFLGRHASDRKKYDVVNANRGRYACTHWSLAKRLGDYSVLRFKLDTGRTHQIRIHCAHIGFPILGDVCYGNREKNPLPSYAQALHALQLGINHPVYQDRMVFQAPVPEFFEKLLNMFRNPCN